MARASSSSLPGAASTRRQSRSKGCVGTLAVVAAGLALLLGALSTVQDIAFAASGPAPPKKPGSGYILWSTSRRPAVVKEMPDKKVTELAKVLGDEWKKLPDSEKAQWNQKSAALLETYKQQVEAWTSQYGAIPKKQKRVAKADKAPPRPGSSYTFFVKAKVKGIMAELGIKNATGAAATLGRMWKEMTDAQKAPYVQEAAAAKAAYAAAKPPAPAGAKASPLKSKAKAKGEAKAKGKASAATKAKKA